MTAGKRPEPHYIKRLANAAWPRVFVYLDTEAHRQASGRGEEQTWRLGVAAIDRRSHRTGEWIDRAWWEGSDQAALWDWIDLAAGGSETTVLICHNLSYDARISDMLRQLGGRDWTLEHVMLERELSWARWSRKRASLVAVDLMTWLPMPLAKVGELVGLDKPALPGPGASNAEWLERCRADVLITAAAWRGIVDWLDQGDHGGFGPTGSTVAWNVWRHRHLTEPVLASAEDDVTEACRRAAWTGRAEAWQHGQLASGRYVEWDYQSAYAQVGLHDTVPTGRVDTLGPLTVDRARSVARHRKLLVDVRARQEVPVLPCMLDGQIVWPVGELHTTVWWGEAADALRAGAQVEVLRGWAWRYGPALRSFMSWCLDHVAGEAEGVTPLRAAIAKHWCRTVVGRTGLRYTAWEHAEGYPWPGWRTGLVVELGGGPPKRELLLGSDYYLEAGRSEGKDACPQIMSYVMSQTRRLLWRCMCLAGFEHVLHVDTDGLIVDQAGDAALAAAELPGLRRKRSYRELEIVGARQLVLDGEPRAAGLQKRAVSVGGLSFEVEEWQRAMGSLAAGRPDRVVVVPRRKTLVGNDVRRVRIAGGQTAPRWVGLDQAGEVVAIDGAVPPRSSNPVRRAHNRREGPSEPRTARGA